MMAYGTTDNTMKTLITPVGHYELYTQEPPMRPMTAILFRLSGSWWLRYENGWEINTHHQAWGQTAYRKEDMVRHIATKKG